MVVDSHNIDYDIVRQYAHASGGLVRRGFAAANWRKLRREELTAYRDADEVYLCSAGNNGMLEEVPGHTRGHPKCGGRRLLSAAAHGPAAR